MNVDPCAVALEIAPSPVLLDQLQGRAEVLGLHMAALRRSIARSFTLIPRHDPVDADRPAHGTIVVALDHSVLQAIAAEMLEGLGHAVRFMDSRMEGASGGDAIDAVILDVPLVNEERLARVRRARQLSPRVIVATSMPDGVALQRLRDAGVDGFVAWPLDGREMALCLRRVLTSGLAIPM